MSPRQRFIRYMLVIFAVSAAIWLVLYIRNASASDGVPAPTASHHQHLISPRFAALIKERELDGADLVRQLDEAGIRQAVVLSMGYTWGDERKAVDDPDAATRAENDWTAAQVRRFPGRLIGFCSVNPLRDAAAAELDRCLSLPGMRGLKLHLGNSGVDVARDDHLERLAGILRLANRRGAAVVAHMRARSGQPYGEAEARIALERLLPLLPDVPFQLAHMGGAGPGFPEQARKVLDVYAGAVAAHDPRVARLWVDVTTVVAPTDTPADLAVTAAAIRAIGVDRIVFGADLPIQANPAPAEAWRQFRRLPLAEAEFRTIAGNVAPYMR